jgi:hypothetical protein
MILTRQYEYFACSPLNKLSQSTRHEQSAKFVFDKGTTAFVAGVVICVERYKLYTGILIHYSDKIRSYNSNVSR